MFLKKIFMHIWTKKKAVLIISQIILRHFKAFSVKLIQVYYLQGVEEGVRNLYLRKSWS